MSTRCAENGCKKWTVSGETLCRLHADETAGQLPPVMTDSSTRAPGDMLNVARPEADALNLAALGGDLQLVKSIIAPLQAAGVDCCSLVDDMGCNALTTAVTGGRADVVAYLLSDGYGYGSSFHRRNGMNSGTRAEDALAAACESTHGSVEVLDLLLRGGAAEDPAEIRGEPCLVRAARAGHVAIVARLLEDNGFSSVDQRQKSATHRSYGGKVDSPTPLVAAAENGHLDVVRLLLEKGAAVDGTTGSAALWRAERGGHTAVAELLRYFGAEEEVQKEPKTKVVAGNLEEGNRKIDNRMFARLNADLSKGRSDMAHGAISRDP